jgi:hypothetical protein
VSDRPTVSQAIAECLQFGEAAKLLSRQGYGMTRGVSKLCKCGCKTVLIWQREKVAMYSNVYAYVLEQKVFCPKETKQTND